jgi:large subunit ribosomal protein L32e
VSNLVNPRKKPEFRRWLSQAYKRLEESWRRPRGIHSKIRIREKGKIKMPSIGWRAPKDLRGLHPSGFKEVVVYSMKDLEKINPEKEAIKISHKVGKKKRQEIIKRANELKIKVLNP